MTMMGLNRARIATVLGVILATAATAADDDWPHLRGPFYAGTSAETDLADAWPADGPPVLWHRPIGRGFSAFAVAGGRAVTHTQYPDGQYVVCLDADTGRRLWRTRTALPRRMEGHWPGPMATPTLVGDRLYFAGAYGRVGCLRAADGRLVWDRDVAREFGARGTEYGYACAPLVLEGTVYLPVGGKGAAVVALDARDGSLRWRTGDWPASYTPCLPVTVGGRRQIVAYLRNVVAAFDPADGRVLWSHRLSEGYDEHAAWPLYAEPSLVLPRAFAAGAVCLRLDAAGGPPAVAWTSPDLSNDVCSSIVLDGYLYGFGLTDYQARRRGRTAGVLRCLDLATGRVRWTTDRVGHASLVAADGKLFLWTETGTLVLARASPQGYEELARTPVFAERFCWTAPALAGGRLLLRTPTQAACLWVGEPEALGPRRPVAAAGRLREAAAVAPAAPDLWQGRALLAPTWRDLRAWFTVSLLAVLLPAAAVAAAVVLLVPAEETDRRRRLGRGVFALTAVVLGAAGPWVLGRAAGTFVFTWPAAVFVLYHATVLASAWAPRGSDRAARRARWMARGAVAGFALAALAFAWACRSLGALVGYGFLAGLVPAAPVELVAAWRMGRRPHPVRDLVWTLVAFAAWFWLSAAFTVWKTHQ